jgi:type II secretory pathway predicted ATPase ExeA
MTLTSMRTIPIGGLDLSNLALRQNAALPVLTEDVAVQEWFTDCLKQTLTERRGVILLAPHGAGKSLAITRNLAQFHEAEERRRSTREATYQPRRVVTLSTLRIDDARELFVALYHAAFDTYPADRVYRRTKTAGEIRDALIARCAEENVVAFVIDEAQTLGTVALEALRDLMATSESAQADRWTATPEGGEVTPAGVGVLLVGTFALQHRLPGLTEYGRRWVRTEKVGLMPAGTVPSALTRVLPSFAEGARVLGEEGWVRLVGQVMTQGRELPVSTLLDITRAYLRRASEVHASADTLAALPWDEGLFRQAGHELLGLVIRSQEAA